MKRFALAIALACVLSGRSSPETPTRAERQRRVRLIPRRPVRCQLAALQVMKFRPRIYFNPC